MPGTATRGPFWRICQVNLFPGLTVGPRPLVPHKRQISPFALQARRLGRGPLPLVPEPNQVVTGTDRDQRAIRKRLIGLKRTMPRGTGRLGPQVPVRCSLIPLDVTGDTVLLFAVHINMLG